MEMGYKTNRVRMNITQTAKGLAQMDVTVEFETVAESEAALSETVKAARRVMAENGMKEVHE